MSNHKLLVLCDSPTLHTGFGRVAQNLLRRWHASGAFEQIHVWGISYQGTPHPLPYSIWPAQRISSPQWYQVPNLQGFIDVLGLENAGRTAGGFTHVWIMQDTFCLTPLAEALLNTCREAGIKSFLYFPVDAPLEPIWTQIMGAVDTAAAYCEYGRREAVKALRIPIEGNSFNRLRRKKAEQIEVIPHGVDCEVYHPLELKDGSARETARETMFKGKVKPTDFLMICVARNQRRKGPSYTLEVLARIRAMEPSLNAKLYMHMPAENSNEQTDLRMAARQLDLRVGEDVWFGDKHFVNNHADLPEETLNAIYGAGDLLLTTSLGEGWGLPITEAMAAGIPVAGPAHTSIAEILGDGRGILFGTCGHVLHYIDNSRLRPVPDVDDAAMKIIAAATSDPSEAGSLARTAERAMAWATSDFLSWDRIANWWMERFGLLRKDEQAE